MRRLSLQSFVVLGCAGFILSACTTSVRHRDLQHHNYDAMAVPVCQPESSGKVFFRGRSHDLEACLQSVGGSRISELRIDSAGGEAAKTLAAISNFLGKIDLLVVDGVCGSSCANYIVPAAEALVVKPDSYILLHGSIDMAYIHSALKSQRADLARRYPDIPAAELDRLLVAAAEDYSGPEKAQAEFENERLSCSDWLHPSAKIIAQHAATPLATRPKVAHWLLVTPSMAARCLRRTAIRGFWSLREGRLPAQLTAIGAVQAD